MSAAENKIKYLESSESIKELHEDSPQPWFDEISSEKEIWLVQCPKDINITELDNVDIKFPGRTHFDKIETIAEEFRNNKDLSIAYKSNGKDYKLENVPVKGRILIRNKLKNVKIDNINLGEKAKTVPFPKDLRVRHPLLGSSYEDKTTVKDEVKKKLRRARKVSNKPKHRIFDVVHLETDDEVKIVSESIADVSSLKAPSRRKRKTDVDSNEPKKKHKKIKEVEDVSNDLAWIKAI